MKKIKRINTLIIIIMILLNIINIYTVQATIKPGDFDPSTGSNQPSQQEISTIVNMANPIIGTIKTVGIILAVITLGIIGIKYITGSVEEKAEYKKTMIPYLIGAVILVATTQLLGIIIELVTGIKQ